MSERVALHELCDHEVHRLICWPEYSDEELSSRIGELHELGITAILIGGRHRLGKTLILGKGHTGLVLTAETIAGNHALKTRRTDADRASMDDEARLLKLANSVGVGPRLEAWTRNFLLMELVEGIYLSDWIKGLNHSDAGELRRVIKDLVDQARRLDEAGLDHGEMVRLRRHTILREGEPVIIDFESASSTRRPANVTTIIQSIYMNSMVSQKVERILGLPNRENLIRASQLYKYKMDKESYQRLLENISLI